MAEKFSHFVLNNRKLFIFLILIYTLFMGYKGLEVEYNYDFSQKVPETDEDRANPLCSPLTNAARASPSDVISISFE